MAVQLPKFKLDCRDCSNKQKKQRGCTQDSIIPDTWELDGWKFSRCPRKIITRQSYEYIRVYNFYKEGGGWPNPGTWQEQPLKVVEIIELIGYEVNKDNKTK